MNKNYIKSLINEMFDRNILNSEDDRAEMKELIAQLDSDLTGNFDDDVEYLTEAWNDSVVEEEEEVSPEEEIQDMVDNLHIGFNFIPGLGFGYCKDEEDLAKMKEFVRGGMTVVSIMGAMMGM